ncbi:eyes absent-like protein 2 [Cucumis melo var. makuwa]|uniref:protein-tyrosine-phosphatase n=2 Tax=Cucumis melo TaxID=3656 RepID=A0A5D3CJY6_CUCMM|nr:eyes absent-like protein 2 [Cucumis melo var. makuwa]TYK11508.1 eyes absent-like protein 2 [Cucumis melo var. makuwa]
MEESKNHLSEQSTKGFAKSTKDQKEKLNVYVWDMDETIILLKSLLDGTYAKAFGGSKDVKRGEELGKMWEKEILDLCDHFFFYEQIENYNQPFLDALNEYDDGRDLSNYDFDQDGFGPPCDDVNKRKLAFRQRAITNKYREGLRNIFDQQKMKHWEELYEMTDVYTDRWFSSARAFLEECSISDEPPHASADQTSNSNSTSSQHVNILVTSGALIPSLVKCLLFRLDHLITPGNVYSSWEVEKVQCFQWIKERFDKPNVRFCAIGNGWEECEAAQSLKWPFVKIDLQPGSLHRFPGLSLKTIGFYFSVIYGNSDSSNDEE